MIEELVRDISTYQHIF